MSAMNNTHLLQLKLNNDDSMTPIRGSEQSAGYDLYSYEEKNILPGETKLFDTGISFRVPIGLSKKGLLVNAGVIDRDYTGPVKIMLHNLSNDNYLVKKNDRIAQLILERIETPEIVVVDSLDDTQRGSDGFGSTGN